MAKYRYVIKMSQNGRNLKDAHSLVFQIMVAGVLTPAAAKLLNEDVVGALAGVMFNSTSFLKGTFTEVDDDGKAYKGATFSVVSNQVGDNALGVGDKMGPEHLVLAIAKSATPSGTGISALRHCMSAQEYADYLTANTIPTRFTAAPVGSYGAGEELGANLMAAFDAHDVTVMLSRAEVKGVVTDRTVTVIEAQDFRLYDPYRTRRTAARTKVAGVLSQLKQWAAQAWRMFRKYAIGEHPADVIATIIGLATKASAAYLALDVAERILIDPPSFPQLGPGA